MGCNTNKQSKYGNNMKQSKNKVSAMGGKNTVNRQYNNNRDRDRDRGGNVKNWYS